ncbi:uncharacterized protein LOC129602262 [Paramacrobiotus metropolitanus]|uniref:uncharacterized protein LOC129602262 n=1 Tax=Paramacrobiotus metropolitanus TaxID=2943436 RepID=UPI002445A57B|nr:uncharacterized protein LOC129602262 [Paramacrobiotus metropolitanus]
MRIRMLAVSAVVFVEDGGGIVDGAAMGDVDVVRRAFVPREYGPVDQVSTLEKAGEVDLRWALQRFCTEQSQRKLQMALDAQERTDRDDLQETAINMRAIRETSGRELLQMETAERYFQGLAQLTTQEICRAYPEYDWRFVAQSKDILDALIAQVDQIGCDAKEILQFADDALESRKLKEVKVEQTDLPGKARAVYRCANYPLHWNGDDTGGSAARRILFAEIEVNYVRHFVLNCG